jgi:dephospho-CoA kinase
MRVLGLTGSIAMGKSATARMLRRLGVPVHDADACVHGLFSKGGRAVGPIAKSFPGVVENGTVNRSKLGVRVFENTPELKKLEAIVHPLVKDERDRFLMRNRRRHVRVVVLDVPLLYETKGQGICDAVMVVSAPAFLQRRRALARPEMTEKKLASILARQMPDHDKRKRADVVVPTGLGLADTHRRIVRYMCRLRKARRQGR